MKKIVENILDVKIDLHNSVGGISFKNEQLENDFLESMKKKIKTINICFSALFCIIYINMVINNFFLEKFKNNLTFVEFEKILILISLMIEILLNILIFKKFNSIKIKIKKDFINFIRCYSFYYLLIFIRLTIFLKMKILSD